VRRIVTIDNSADHERTVDLAKVLISRPKIGRGVYESSWVREFAEKIPRGEPARTTMCATAENCHLQRDSHDYSIIRVVTIRRARRSLASITGSPRGVDTAHLKETEAAFREIVRKYPQRVLRDLVARTPRQEGKWFAAAKEAGLLEMALILLIISNVAVCD
jgi:hypothetical protein